LQSECVAAGPTCTKNPISPEDAEKDEYVFTGDANDAINEMFARSSEGGAWYRQHCGENSVFSQKQLSNQLTYGLAGHIKPQGEAMSWAAGFQNETWPTFYNVLPAMVFWMLQHPCTTAKLLGGVPAKQSGWSDISVFALMPALDMTGRWSKEQTEEIIVSMNNDPTFGPGLKMFTLYASAMYGWPTLPMPIGFNNEEVPTLIAQTLYDDRTGMNLAQQYKLNFGNSVMVTQLGAGHCVGAQNGKDALKLMEDFILTGARPNDGTITGVNPVPIDFAHGAALAKKHLAAVAAAAADKVADGTEGEAAPSVSTDE